MITTAPGSNGKLDEVGFCYSENRQEPTWLDNRLIIDDATQLNTTYTATLKGLKENTTYYVRMYAKNTVDGSARYGYGETKQFTTGQLSTPIFDEFTNVSAEAQSITLTANLSNYDEGAIVEKGFYWATSINDCTLEKAAILGNSMKVTDGGRAFSATITGLSVGVLYYVAAYAVYQSDQREATGYSDPYPVTTSGFTVPVLNTPVISDETYFGATVTGVIRSQGNGQITSKGFVVSRDYDEPTIDYCDFHAYADDNFQHTFTELNNGTFYYVRAYVVCELAGQKQTVYSDYTTFSTTAVESAVLKDLTVTDVTQSGAKFASGLNSAGDGELTEAGFIWAASADLSETLNLEKATGKQKVELTGSMDNFELTLTDLKYSTEYKARAYVKTLVDGKLEQVSYSGTVYFSTSDPQSASLSNFSYTNVSLHSIDVSIEIGSAGDGTMVEKGFCWVPTESISYWSSVTLDNAENHIAVTDGTETAFQATITGLTADTQYRIAAYVITELDGVKRNAYSEYRDVSTAAAQLPSMNAPTVSNVNFFDATFKLNMYDEGNYTLTRKGVCLSATRSDPVINDCDYVQDFGQDNTCTVSQLKPGTTYYARSFAVCTLEGEETTTYSDARTFSTSEITAPSMKNITVSNILFTSFDLACGVRETGDGEITEKGFCWVKTSDLSDYWAVPTLDNATGSLAISDGDADSFSGTASSLEMNVEYRVAAYVKYQVGNNQYSGVAYSENTSVSTATPELPSLSAPEVSDITYKAATFTYQLSSAGNYEITERGVVLSKSSSSPDIHSHDATATYDSDGVCTLNGLDRETTYYYRSYAKCKLNYDEQVVYSDGNSFSTNADLAGATIKSPTCPSQTTTSLTVESSIIDMGDGEFSEKGFCWRVDDGIQPTLENCDGSQVSVSTTNDSFSLTISSLQSNTSYSVRAYVKTMFNWETIISYSDVLNCATNDYVAATVKNITCTTQSTYTLTVEGGIADMGNGTLEEKGFIWKVGNSGTPTLESYDGSLAVTGTENSTYSATLTGLDYDTEYRIRSYVKTIVDGKSVTAYSNTITAATNGLTATTFTTPTCTAQTTSTLTIQTGIENVGDGDLTEKGVCWRVADGVEPILDNCDGSQVSPSTDNKFTMTLSGLSSGTTYSVRAYVKVMVNWETQIYYSDVLSASTNDFILATLKELTCAAQTTSTLTVETGITDMGNGTFVEKGFVWRIGDSYEPTISSYDGTLVTTAENNSAYTTVLSGLEAGTTYSIRAYVKTTLDNQEIVAYSNTVVSTTTDYVSATMKGITCTAQTTTTLTVESGITDMGNGDFVEKGFLWRAGSSGTPTLDNCDSSVKVEGTDRSSYSATLTGLQVGTSYRLRGYTKTSLDGTTLVAYTDVITASTYDKVAATMYYISTSLEDDCKISMTGGINNLGSGDLVEKGFCWKIDASPTLESCDGHVAVKDGSDDSYSTSVDGLHYNSTYYIRAYAKTVIDGDTLVSYSSYDTRTTRSIDISYSLNVGESYVDITMSCSSEYTDLITEWSAAILVEGDTTKKLNDDSYTKADKGTAHLIGLKGSTQYVIRMRAKHKDGYYIYQDTDSWTSLKGPSKGDLSSPSVNQ
jgi:hypothetical protein